MIFTTLEVSITGTNTVSVAPPEEKVAQAIKMTSFQHKFLFREHPRWGTVDAEMKDSPGGSPGLSIKGYLAL